MVKAIEPKRIYGTLDEIYDALVKTGAKQITVLLAPNRFFYRGEDAVFSFEKDNQPYSMALRKTENGWIPEKGVRRIPTEE